MNKDLTKLLESYPGHNSPDMSTKDLLDWAVEVDPHIPRLIEIVKDRQRMDFFYELCIRVNKELSELIDKAIPNPLGEE
ncbi:hypothetical protein LCGC14_2601790 [marine sediment metagenome]|uniref:Uncharacterized protein n=1 Tax=marine sediment metagenome TaxID=412755 RepID=A0A0F9CJI8_9ZZZZ